jgi:hypothetical protein
VKAEFPEISDMCSNLEDIKIRLPTNSVDPITLATRKQLDLQETKGIPKCPLDA